MLAVLVVVGQEVLVGTSLIRGLAAAHPMRPKNHFQNHHQNLNWHLRQWRNYPPKPLHSLK